MNMSAAEQAKMRDHRLAVEAALNAAGVRFSCHWNRLQLIVLVKRASDAETARSALLAAGINLKI